MRLVDRIFGNKNKELENKVTDMVQLLNAHSASFTRYDGSIYESDAIRSAIHTIAKHAAKAKAEVVGDAYKDLARIVQVRPNDFMDGYKFIYNIVTILKVTSTCFIVPLYAEDEMTLTGFYPINPSQAELVEYKGTLFMRYRFNGGAVGAIEFDRVGIMTDFQYKDDLVGDGNLNTLSPLLTILDQQRQAIELGMIQGSQLKFSAIISENVRPEDRKALRKEFKEENLSMDGTGLMMIDNRYKELKQLKPDTFIIDKEQLDFVSDSINNYFGINKDILQNSYDEDTWSAFYEGTIEPILLQLSMVLTNMTFNREEILQGSEWLFTSNRLQYASNETKANVSQMLFDRGLATTNQILDIWNLPNVEGGDLRYIRKEYAELTEDGTAQDVEGSDIIE